METSELLNSSTEETDEEVIKAYVQLPERIVNSCRAKLGNVDLHSDAVEVLLEDANYELRVITSSAILTMRHGRRCKILASDFKKALSSTSSDEVYNDGFYDLEGNLVNLKEFAEETEEYEENRQLIHCYGKWLNTCDSKKVKSSSDLRIYFDLIVKAILDDDDEVAAFTISDLKTNPNILPLVPYFMHFLTIGIKKSDDILQLQKFIKVTNSLLINPALYHFRESYLDNLLTSAFSCITRPLGDLRNFNNRVLLQNMSAHFLFDILKADIGKSKKKLYLNVISRLEATFKDTKEPFYSHYGTIVALISLGVYSIAKVIPIYFSSYCNHLDNGLASSDMQTKYDAYMVHGELLLACKLLIRHCLANDFKVAGCATEVHDPLAALATEVHDPLAACAYVKETPELKEGSDIILPYSLFMDFLEYFGDSLADCQNFIQIKKTQKSSFGPFANNIFQGNKMENVDQVHEKTLKRKKSNNASTSQDKKIEISADADLEESPLDVAECVKVSPMKLRTRKKKKSDKISSFRERLVKSGISGKRKNSESTNIKRKRARFGNVGTLHVIIL